MPTPFRLKIILLISVLNGMETEQYSCSCFRIKLLSLAVQTLEQLPHTLGAGWGP